MKNNLLDNQMGPEYKLAKESRATKISIVLPPDTNHHGTLFGGRLMAYIDDVATISASRHARLPVVTASTDYVAFLQPVRQGQTACLTSFVSYTGKSSMEVFVKVVAEDLLTGERTMCATAFLTFVALDEQGKPASIPQVIPETPEEKILYESAPKRKEERKRKREESQELAEMFGTRKIWEA